VKTRLRLDAEIDLLNKGELTDALDQAGAWERQAAFGLRHQELPRMVGTPSGGSLNLGGDQAEGTFCGPKSGQMWKVTRIAVDGLASGDAVKVYKDTRFIGWISYQPGYVVFGHGCVLKPGDFLRVTGTSLTATGQIEVYGEGISAPAPLMWKLIS
jgi:hypothetical protein